MRNARDRSEYIKAIALLLMALCFLCCPRLTTAAKNTRGDAPHCQKECLANHAERMKRLSDQYQKTGDKMRYQHRVEEELMHYSQCPSDCHEVLPVK